MKKVYDFFKGNRGKFYRNDVQLNVPIYLDEDNQEFINSIVKKKKSNSTIVVNEILRSDKEIAKTLVV